jgi:hypothetical protein
MKQLRSQVDFMGINVILQSSFIWCFSRGKGLKPWMLREMSKHYENRLTGRRIGM